MKIKTAVLSIFLGMATSVFGADIETGPLKMRADLNVNQFKGTNAADAVAEDDWTPFSQAKNAGILTNQFRTLTWIVQDPTNDLVWPQFHPADGDGNWTVDEVSVIFNNSNATGLASWVIGDLPLNTGSTSLEADVVLGATRIVDSSLSGFTTLSNDQAIGFFITDLSEFDITNVCVATARLTK